MDSNQDNSQYLDTPDGHRLHYACFGDPGGIPILFLHGGPGSSCHAGDARLFLPEASSPLPYHLIQTDQRGCGQSTPGGSLHNNTTAHLLADIEQLRSRLGMERWQVYGGSWGAALALEYAKQHPERVTRLLLRGTFLARQGDLDWFVHPTGAALLFPEAYRQLCHHLQALPGENLLHSLYRQLLQAEQAPERAYACAHALSSWNATLMRVPAPGFETDPQQRQARIRRELIFSHYCTHGFWLPVNGVLAGIEALRDLPVTLIHGQQDQVCRPEGVHTLCEYLPQARLRLVAAGHGLHEAAIWQAMQEELALGAIH